MSKMRILKTRVFERWARKIKLLDWQLYEALEQITSGLYDANLGGFLYKKRIAMDNKGKSGSLRTIIAYKVEDKAFFLYGFTKNQRENITETEMIALKDLAKLYFSCTDEQITIAVKNKKLIEVRLDEKKHIKKRS